MVNGVTVKGVTTGCACPFGGCGTPASARRVAVGPDGVGRERPNADGRRGCLAPLHTEANEGLLGGKCFLPDPDREAWAVCQPRLRHDAAIPQPGARPEGSGGAGCPWVGRFGTRWDLVAPLN